MANTCLETKPFVVNWHLLDPCNFSCAYCYAQWSNSNSNMPIVFKEKSLTESLIKEIALLQKNNSYIRLSFAGGEPLLDTGISHKIDFSYSLGLKNSIITNGSLLSKRLDLNSASKLFMIGISIDSMSNETNKKIGRGVKGVACNYEDTIYFLNKIRELNPDLKIKINTVINRFNWHENLSEIIMTIKPDKWKVLRVLPATSKSKKETISDAQYEHFRSTHSNISCAQFENNDDMNCSYLMIDPYGRFFYNSSEGYKYTQPILEVGIETALQRVEFDYDKFSVRYQGSVE